MRLTNHERLVTAIVWAHGPVNAVQVMDRLVNDYGVTGTMLKAVSKTITGLVHKGALKRELSLEHKGFAFRATDEGEAIACAYLLNAEAAR